MAAETQAGGGVSSMAIPAHQDNEIQSFEASVLGALRKTHEQVQKGGKGVLHEEQKNLAESSFVDFLKYMASSSSNALKPAPTQNLDLPFPSYFISSSHNTYLTGHQLYGNSSVEGYKNVLLRGCRCVEIDCWDGDDDSAKSSPAQGADKKSAVTEPVVLHGYTATREITFRSVCETIREYAFVTTDLPLIVSLEVHTNQAQQHMMVDIMDDCFKGMLCQPIEADNQDSVTNLPSLQHLRKKILIKVKYSPTKVESAPGQGALANTEAADLLSKIPSRTDTSPSSSDDDEAPGASKKKAKPKVSKIIDKLSHMGIYTRSYHYSGLSTPEAKVPSHVFSLSERSLTGVHKADPEGLFNHNKSYLMRAYPKGTRIASSNLDPSLFWRVGVQMVALNWQRIDCGMMLQEAMFQGTGGWALKPKSYLSQSTFQDSRSHTKLGKSWIKVKAIAAQNIPMPDDVEPEKFRPYIKCEVHVEMPNQEEPSRTARVGKSKNPLKKTVGPSKGQNPDFGGQLLEFKDLPSIIPELSFVRFKIMHSDRFGRDDFAAWACIRLDRLAPGYRLIRLWDQKGAPSDGALLAHIDFGWNVV